MKGFCKDCEMYCELGNCRVHSTWCVWKESGCLEFVLKPPPGLDAARERRDAWAPIAEQAAEIQKLCKEIRELKSDKDQLLFRERYLEAENEQLKGKGAHEAEEYARGKRDGQDAASDLIGKLHSERIRLQQMLDTRQKDIEKLHEENEQLLGKAAHEACNEQIRRLKSDLQQVQEAFQRVQKAFELRGDELEQLRKEAVSLKGTHNQAYTKGYDAGSADARTHLKDRMRSTLLASKAAREMMESFEAWLGGGES